MVFLVIAILEADAPTYTTHYDIEFKVNRSPIVGWPINLVLCLDENLDFTRHYCITFDSEARTLGVGVLDRRIFDPNDARRFA